MIGDHPVRGLVGALRRDPGRVRHRLDERAEQIRVVVRSARPAGSPPMRSRPMPVSMEGFGRLTRLPGSICSYCMKTRFQNLEEPVAVLVRAAGRAALQRVALVDEDLRARTARAGIAHLPEIVGGRDADDLGIGEAGDLLPQRHGLLVVVIDGDEEPVLGQPELLGDQVPGELDGARP